MKRLPTAALPMVEPIAEIRTMKKIGIVGGMAWLSTVEYYTAICQHSEAYHAARSLPGIAPTPEITIESLDLRKAVALMGTLGDEPSWYAFDAYHRDALLRLEAGGSDVAIIASNTPHHRLAAISVGVAMPVIGIHDAVARECVARNVRMLVVLGTWLTMNSPVVREVFKGYGISVITPNAEDQARVVEFIEDLQCGRERDGARALAAIVRHTLDDATGAGWAVSLACTELPLAFPNDRFSATFRVEDVRYMNSAAIHARAAFEWTLQG